MLNSSGVVKRAKENRVAYVEHMEQLWSGQERKGKQVAYVEQLWSGHAKENRVAYVELNSLVYTVLHAKNINILY